MWVIETYILVHSWTLLSSRRLPWCGREKPQPLNIRKLSQPTPRPFLLSPSPNPPVSWFFSVLTFPFSELTAPISMLLLMLSRWPRYFSQGPAMEIWSVVHLPLALMRISASCTVKGPECV